MIVVKDIFESACELAPLRLAYDWDNSGLQVGDFTRKVSKVLITLDVSSKVVEEAVNKQCQLIVAHHPLIFKPLSAVNMDSSQGRIIADALQGGISILSFHTNLDLAHQGLNDYFASLIALEETKPLKIEKEDNFYKLIVYAPEENYEKLRNALFAAGAGRQGQYSSCSFSSSGEGTFKPLEGSNPYRGCVGKTEKVQEKRLEVLVKEDSLHNVLGKMFEVHPYEEAAYDLLKLENNPGKSYGLGRIGKLKESYRAIDFIYKLKEKLDLEHIKYCGSREKQVKKVAVCTGSGADLIKNASRQGADMFITSDIKYHEAQSAEEEGIFLVDIGHYQSEIIVRDLLQEYFKENFNNVTFIKSKINTDPWQYF